MKPLPIGVVRSRANDGTPKTQWHPSRFAGAVLAVSRDAIGPMTAHPICWARVKAVVLQGTQFDHGSMMQ
jgi:hypothetical protein